MKLLVLLSIAFAFVLVASGEQRPPSVNNPDPLQAPKTPDEENNDENEEMETESQEGGKNFFVAVVFIEYAFCPL